MDDISVLVCDDSALMRNLIGRIVDETTGLKVCGKAENGQDLLDKIPQCNPDVILLDIEMPVMNGIEATKKLKSDSKYSSIPVVAITAHNLEDFASEFGDAGFDTILEKPYSEETVLEVLKNLKLL